MDNNQTDAPPILLAPSPTPFAQDDSVDFTAIEHNMAIWRESSLSGYVLNSENGEESFLSESDRIQIIKTVSRGVLPPQIIVAGIDSPSVTESLHSADDFAAAGANYLRVRIPRLTKDVDRYFSEFSNRTPLPFVIIHQTAPGHFLGGPAPDGAKPEQIVNWLAHEHVFGYIASANLRFEARVRELSDTKQFWIGNASILLPGIAIGGNGGCMMLANVAPQKCRDIIELTMDGQISRAQETHADIVEADWQILSRGAAGLKTALQLLGFRVGTPRSPSPPCNAIEEDQIRRALVSAGLLP